MASYAAFFMPANGCHPHEGRGSTLTTNTNETHLTPVELAQRWKVSAAHLANLRWESRGCAYLKIGASVRYRLADVLAYEAQAVVTAVA